ncbi:uncharacterized protein MONBRDRAFT_38717 [Monosiga brevicollis MX1]|uniref:Aminotransferase class I/classII large domain-containing protein n=1 Tax=Monosiga brevicollis TaxID=81824 RepID=A9V9P9_MONBE|nr:uncharacterized protein MONBRDRAFT_38717 [Monosiga brevicollis MX1]EDQ85760.1 predicted protein [Monosiga brevicollis MX1]|eukprot:XP_001749475.1 hypothetical protein [Monosiga brevicollis MX1]
MAASDQMAVSGTIRATDEPCIVKMNRILEGSEDVASLAQGVTYWNPPEACMAAATAAIGQMETNRYNRVEGVPELTAALTRKLEADNKLHNQGVMVTMGANQAFMNVLLTLCEPGDEVMLFLPYYFNHHMALQMTGMKCRKVARRPDTFELDMDAIKQHVSECKMVVLVNPCNPSGAVTDAETLNTLSELCRQHNTYLVVDNTYEDFIWDDAAKHTCIQGPHVLNIFSFSKAYGLMGWRVGYIAYELNSPELAQSLLKVQDTIPICPCIISQRAAVAALEQGSTWVAERVATLAANRQAVLDALATVDGCQVLGQAQGAIYIMVRLPVDDDMQAVEWLARQHHVAVIPGSACGARGHIRVAFANLDIDQCMAATARLVTGLQELQTHGSTAFSRSS